MGENQYGSIRRITYQGSKVKVENSNNKTSMQMALERAGLVDSSGISISKNIENDTNIRKEIRDREYSLPEIKELFYNWNADKDISLLADKVFFKLESIIKEQTEDKFKLPFPIRFVNEEYIRSHNGNYRGAFSNNPISELYGITYNSDVFNSNKITDQLKASIILHEAIHACTIYAMKTVEMVYPEYYETLSVKAPNDWPIEMKAALSLFQIYAQISVAGEMAEYGQLNAYEMVAELSKPEFREFLKQQSLWKRVVNAIKDILGIDSTNALDATYRALDKLLDDYKIPSLYSLLDKKNDIKVMQEPRDTKGIYNKKNYEHHAWAVANNLLTKKQIGAFTSKIAELKSGYHFDKTPEGLYIIPVGDENRVNNTFIMTDGDFDRPSINRIVKINLDNETEIDLLRRYVYAEAFYTSSDIENLWGEKIIEEYFIGNVKNYRQYRTEFEERQRNNNEKSAQNAERDSNRTRSGRSGEESSLSDFGEINKFSIPSETSTLLERYEKNEVKIRREIRYDKGYILPKEYNELISKKPIKVNKSDWAKVNSERSQKYSKYSDSNIPLLDFFELAEYNKLNKGYIYVVRNIDKYSFSIIKKRRIKPEFERIRKEEVEKYERTNQANDRNETDKRNNASSNSSSRHRGTIQGNEASIDRNEQSDRNGNTRKSSFADGRERNGERDSLVFDDSIRKERRAETYSDRDLLVMALESSAINETERDFLKRYKSKIGQINEWEKQLQKNKTEIYEMQFQKTKEYNRDRFLKLNSANEILNNKIQKADKLILKLRNTSALKNLVKRERDILEKKLKIKNQENLKKYRESTRKTEVKNKIRNKIVKLSGMLAKGTDKKHIPISLIETTLNLC